MSTAHNIVIAPVYYKGSLEEKAQLVAGEIKELSSDDSYRVLVFSQDEIQIFQEEDGIEESQVMCYNLEKNTIVPEDDLSTNNSSSESENWVDKLTELIDKQVGKDKKTHIFFFVIPGKDKKYKIDTKTTRSVKSDEHIILINKLIDFHTGNPKDINIRNCTKGKDKGKGKGKASSNGSSSESSESSESRSGSVDETPLAGVTVVPTYYDKKTKKGDFKDLIKDKKERKTLFIFNDNTCRRGDGGTAEITKDEYNKYKNKAGLATGIGNAMSEADMKKKGIKFTKGIKYKKGISSRGGFQKLTDRVVSYNSNFDATTRASGSSKKRCYPHSGDEVKTVQEYIDEDIADIRAYCKKKGYDKIRYSCEKKNGKLGADIFDVGAEVIDYMTVKLQGLGEHLDLSESGKEEGSDNVSSNDTSSETSSEASNKGSKKGKKKGSKKGEKLKKKETSKKITTMMYGHTPKDLGIKKDAKRKKINSSDFKSGPCILPYKSKSGKTRKKCQMHKKLKVETCATRVDKHGKVEKEGICEKLDCISTEKDFKGYSQ